MSSREQERAALYEMIRNAQERREELLRAAGRCTGEVERLIGQVRGWGARVPEISGETGISGSQVYGILKRERERQDAD